MTSQGCFNPPPWPLRRTHGYTHPQLGVSHYGDVSYQLFTYTDSSTHTRTLSPFSLSSLTARANESQNETFTPPRRINDSLTRTYLLTQLLLPN